MARGWESKSVEAQIEQSESGLKPGQKQKADPVEMERRRKREDLELARTRVLNDLETSHSFKMEQILRASLKHLDEKIAELK